MTTFLHTPSWLNWVDEDEVDLKEKPEDTGYIKIRPEAPAVRAKEFDPNFAIIGTADSGKCRCVAPEGILRGCEMSWPGGAYNQVYKLWFPPDQGGGVQRFWN